jgi:hypothetical protein
MGGALVFAAWLAADATMALLVVRGGNAATRQWPCR